MNQRTMKSAVHKFLEQLRRDIKSVDAFPVSDWSRGLLRGAEQMWVLVRGHMKPGGAVWESKRYRALESLISVSKEVMITIRRSNPKNDALIKAHNMLEKETEKAEVLL